MVRTNTNQDVNAKRKRQKKDALKKLHEIAENKITLQRPVFFIP